MNEIKVANAILPEELNLADDDNCCPAWSGPISESPDKPIRDECCDDDDD